MLVRATLIATLLMATPAQAEPLTGNRLHQACMTAETDLFCLGWVIGAFEGAKIGVVKAARPDDLSTLDASANSVLGICIGDAQNSQVIDVFKKYLADHPEKRHHTARLLLLDSLSEAFPCR